MYTVFGAYKNADMTEGKGPMILDKIFKDLGDAHIYVGRQKGIMGRTLADMNILHWGDLGDWQVKELQIMENLADVEKNRKDELVKSALSKLTKAEANALGLSV